MNWGKAIGLLILMILTFPIGGFIWIPILFFGWKYVKFCIKIDIIVIYLIVRIPIWFFIQLPLYSIKYSTQKIDEVFSRGFNALNRRRKLSIFLIVIFGAFYLFIFPTNMQEFEILSAYFWWNNIVAVARIVVGALGTTIIALTIIETFSGGVAQEEMPGEWAKSELFAAFGGEAVNQSVDSAQRAVEGVRKGQRGAQKAKGVYSDIKTADKKGAIKSAVPSDIGKVLTDLAESFGLRGGAAEAAAAAGSNPLGWLALGVFFLALLIFVVQVIVVVVFFIGYLQFIAPMVLGPVTAALGLGSDYGNYLGGEVADRYLAGIQVNVEQYVDPVIEARQRVYCLLEGPACMRQWRLNNTRNPGSEAVGEQYLLEIDRLEVGSGSQMDIANRNGGYEVPLSFGLSNSRNGLKGINAYNISYRVRMIDFERGRDDPFCDTGWRAVNGYDISDWNGFDNSEDSNWGQNDLYPGTSASTGFLTLDDFSLQNCGMLQPGAGETRTVLLDVKYDYFSQATLYFDAMAQETLLTNPGVQKEWKESETADTPVKSAINVNSPVIFDQDKLPGEDAAQPFSMRASLMTEESDVNYRVKNITVTKSSQVEIVEPEESSSNTQECSFRNTERNEDQLILDGSSRNILEGVNRNSNEEQEDRRDFWYDSNNAPPFFGCTMRLSDPADINPEGETLTMGVESNYTVRLNEQLERFEVLNSQCSNMNCPLLVPMNFAQQAEKPENWKYTCEGPDAGRSGETRGCSVVKGDPGDWANVRFNKMTGNDLLESRLERGEMAIDPFRYDQIYSSVSQNLTKWAEDEFGSEKEGNVAIGLTDTQIGRLENGYYTNTDRGRYGYVIVSEGWGSRDTERDVFIEALDEKLCQGQDPEEQLEEKGYSGEDRRVIAAQIIGKDCSSSDGGGTESQDLEDCRTRNIRGYEIYECY